MPHDQLGFEALLTEADTANDVRRTVRETGHLPGSYEDAIPFYRDLIDRHHAAMMAADVKETLRLREEAHRLALRLNDDNHDGRSTTIILAGGPSRRRA